MELSLRYQVLCKQTAMIGVVKQKEKATGELKEYEQTFSKSVKKVVAMPDPYSYSQNYAYQASAYQPQAMAPLYQSYGMQSQSTQRTTLQKRACAPQLQSANFELRE